MVYAGKVGKKRVTFGVSGRLDKSNLVMWDPETESLWNQMLGRAVHGPLKGKTLDMVPARFLPLAAWRELHPDTRVLDLSPVAVRQWHFTASDLKRGFIEGRGGRQRLGVGLREGEDALVVGLPLLHERRILNVRLGERRLAVAWIGAHSAIAVWRRPEALELRREEKRFVDERGREWDLLRGRPAGKEDGAALELHPFIPTFVEAWKAHHPKTRVQTK